MARRMNVEITDDIDPTHTADETVHFSLDGIHYEIDLAAIHAQKLRSTFTMWIDAARKVGKKPVHHKRSTVERMESAAIREWAKANNITVSPRGRIPHHIVNAYHQRNTTKTDAQRVQAALEKAQAKA